MAQSTTGAEWDRDNGEGTRTDRVYEKAVARFYKVARKFPEDAHIGSLIGRRYEVRVTDLGGRGLAQINQRTRTIKVTKSAAEAQRLADENGGAVWDRQIGYLVYEAGDNAGEDLRRSRREKRDGGTWGWFGAAKAGEVDE